MSAASVLEMPVPQEAGLADVLSPSRVSTYLQCSAKFWYRYGLQFPSTQGSSLTIGRALHMAIKVNFEQKMETHRDLPTAGVVAVYQDAWLNEQPNTEFKPDEKPDELRAMGAALVVKYMDEAAPRIEPAAVELPVNGVIGGVPVRGFVDLMDTQGRIVDLKSANKSPSKTVRPDYRFQIATYSALTRGASGAARLDTVVKLKREVKFVTQEFTVTAADRRSIEVMYPLAQEGMRSGIYMPNRNGMLCSRRYCSYWRKCEGDFGGVVAGGDDE